MSVRTLPLDRPRGGIRCALGLLAACILAPCSTGVAGAATRTVGNCNDGGPGSLRAAAAAAASGDTIDLRRLSCPRITLTTGEIQLTQDNIRLVGPGRMALTLHGNHASRVLDHRGGGTLVVQGLSLSYGKVVEGVAVGGCIASRGNVELRQSRVHHCIAESNGDAGEPAAYGGGVDAAGYVLLDRSGVFGNRAGPYSYGGGIFAARTILLRSQVYDNVAEEGGGVMTEDLRAIYSIIQNNRAATTGGGAEASGSVEISKSTVSGNHADAYGALRLAPNDQRPVVIADSTISGNVTDNGVAVYISTDGRAEIFNTTITGNSSCAGAVAYNRRLRLESSIVAGNACGATASDFAPKPVYATAVTGSHNLVGSAPDPMPGDTLFSNAPGLGPLAWNGGPTRTHAVLNGSPAIDRGNNVLHRVYDQRGAPHPRVHGTGPDIGSYER